MSWPCVLSLTSSKTCSSSLMVANYTRILALLPSFPGSLRRGSPFYQGFTQGSQDFPSQLIYLRDRVLPVYQDWVSFQVGTNHYGCGGGEKGRKQCYLWVPGGPDLYEHPQAICAERLKTLYHSRRDCRGAGRGPLWYPLPFWVDPDGLHASCPSAHR